MQIEKYKLILSNQLDVLRKVVSKKRLIYAAGGLTVILIFIFVLVTQIFRGSKASQGPITYPITYSVSPTGGARLSPTSISVLSPTSVVGASPTLSFRTSPTVTPRVSFKTYKINGTVYIRSNKGYIPLAEGTITIQSKNSNFSGNISLKGKYEISNIIPGLYEIKVFDKKGTQLKNTLKNTNIDRNKVVNILVNP